MKLVLTKKEAIEQITQSIAGHLTNKSQTLLQLFNRALENQASTAELETLIQELGITSNFFEVNNTDIKLSINK